MLVKLCATVNLEEGLIYQLISVKSRISFKSTLHVLSQVSSKFKSLGPRLDSSVKSDKASPKWRRKSLRAIFRSL